MVKSPTRGQKTQRLKIVRAPGTHAAAGPWGRGGEPNRRTHWMTAGKLGKALVDTAPPKCVRKGKRESAKVEEL